MKAAINVLTRALENAETSEIIDRSSGMEKRADLEAVKASELRQALAVLNAANGGPIWPLPTAI